MSIRFFLDEDCSSRALISGLRARGIDVTAVVDEGRTGLDDEAQLALATSLGRVLCTSNTRDFYRLHTEYLKEGRSHAGIVFIPQQRFGVGEQIRRLAKLAAVKTAESLDGQVEFLSAW